MGKQAKTAVKKQSTKATGGSKNWSKVIRAVKNPKTGGYSFSETMVNKDKVKEYLQQQAKN